MTTGDERPLISVVFSFRNEAENIPLLLTRITAVFETLEVDYELVFVNDASTDASLSILQRQSETNARVRILTTSRRFGVSECVRAGMRIARGDAVIYMDADLQDPPEVIPRLLDEWRRGADVVHTIRTRRHGESALKMWMTRLAYRLIQVGSTVDLPVNAGDFKLLSRSVVTHLLQLRESDPYLRGLVVWLGFTQVMILYEREPRFGGRTHFPLFSRNPWKTFLLGVTGFSFMPIYACGALTAVGAIAALLLLASAAALAFAGHPLAMRIALVGLLMLLWVTVLGAISAVGLYVIRIYKDVRGRPQVVIASTAGFHDSADATEWCAAAEPESRASKRGHIT